MLMVHSTQQQSVTDEEESDKRKEELDESSALSDSEGESNEGSDDKEDLLEARIISTK